MKTVTKRGEQALYSKILLASDGSEHALRAAKAALNLVTKDITKITLLYVLDPNKLKKSHNSTRFDEEFIKQKREEKLQQTEELFTQFGVNYQVKICEGEPEAQIAKYANHHQHDVLIIGSRGLNAFQEMVMGSVSHKVMKVAKCPIMVVK